MAGSTVLGAAAIKARMLPAFVLRGAGCGLGVTDLSAREGRAPGAQPRKLEDDMHTPPPGVRAAWWGSPGHNFCRLRLAG